MKVSIVLQGTKQELDRVVEFMDWKATPRNDRHGWNGTTVTHDGERIGNIEPARSGNPCRLEIEASTGEHAAQVVVAAFTAGAIQKMKEQSNENR